MKYPKIPRKISKIRIVEEIDGGGKKQFLSHRDSQKNVIRAETSLIEDFNISTNVHAWQ